MTEFERKEYDQAVFNFTKAISVSKERNAFSPNIDEGTHVYLNNRGLAYSFMPDSHLKEAVADFTEAIRLCKDDPAIWFNRGNAYVSTGTEQNIEHAFKDYDMAISISPYNSKFYHAKGLAKQAMIACIETRLRHEFFETLSKLRTQRARSKSRDSKRKPDAKAVPVAWETQATKANEKHYFDAIFNFTKALDLNDKAADSRYHLAIVLFKAGQVADAIKQMSKVVEMRKDDKQVWLERGQIF